MALTRDRRAPHLHLSLDLHTRPAMQQCAFRCANPTVAAVPSTSASTPAARTGEFRLSDFEKLNVLGRGSGGTVYKVRHRRTSAHYALKILHIGDPTAAAETDVLSRTESPFVVRCHSVLPGASGDVAFLLELMDGGSLDSLVSRRSHRAFPEAALSEVAAQAFSGLAYLHSRRIVHRDIKPANLLVSAAGEVKIADFGIAKVLSRTDDQCTSYEGTAAYMSPERFDTESHDGRHDPYAADVWSLGMTILELFMGRYPLLPAGEKPCWAALMCAICFGELPALPEGTASKELWGFVAACLQRDYKERASVPELLAHPFVARRDVATSRRALRDLVDEASGGRTLSGQHDLAS